VNDHGRLAGHPSLPDRPSIHSLLHPSIHPTTDSDSSQAIQSVSQSVRQSVSQSVSQAPPPHTAICLRPYLENFGHDLVAQHLLAREHEHLCVYVCV
jgi:hypothetical protein